MLKTLIKNYLRPLGIELRRIPTQKEIYEQERQKALWLSNMNIHTIIDIGANDGHFANKIHKILPNAQLYSFEPLKDCYEKLLNKFAEVKTFKAFNLALGNKEEKVEIHRSEYSPSSSLLPMTELHKTSFPFTKNKIIEEVYVVKLDDIVSQLQLQSKLLIKLDVQGFEDKVIEGGLNTFKQADVVLTELSVEELYQGQKLFDDIYQMLKSLGFEYRGNYEQLYHPEDGRVLQMDGIFIKNS